MAESAVEEMARRHAHAHRPGPGRGRPKPVDTYEVVCHHDTTAVYLCVACGRVLGLFVHPDAPPCDHARRWGVA